MSAPRWNADGSVTVIRSLPGFGMYLHVTLTPSEVQAIREAGNALADEVTP